MSGEYVPELNIGREQLRYGSRLGYLARSIAAVLGRIKKVTVDGVRAFSSLRSEPDTGRALSSTRTNSDAGAMGSTRPVPVQENAARLLDACGDSILRLAYAYLHNMQDAEDILQETLIRYMRAKPEFENDTHAKAWLLRVTANLSKNRIEYNRYRMADELNEELVAEEREDLSYVWEAVKSLPETYRETIHLYYQDGYPTAQIAEILEEKESTVRSHLKRGREKLREILKEAYDFEE